MNEHVLPVTVWALALVLVFLNAVWIIPALWHAGQEWMTDLLEDDATPTSDSMTAPPPRPFVSDWSTLPFTTRHIEPPLTAAVIVDIAAERERRHLGAAVHSSNAARPDALLPPRVSA